MGQDSVAACVVGLLKKLVVVVWMLWEPPLDPFAAAPCPPASARVAVQAHAAAGDSALVIVHVVRLRSA
jgi:hypothetical protein